MKQATVVAIVTLLVLSFATVAAAQRISSQERSAIFAGTPRLQTSVKGVTVLAAPSKNFDPLTATNRELLMMDCRRLLTRMLTRQGLPVAESDAGLKDTRDRRPIATVYEPRNGGRQADGSGDPGRQRRDVLHLRKNWSGIANTNANKVWSNNLLR